MIGRNVRNEDKPVMFPTTGMLMTLKMTPVAANAAGRTKNIIGVIHPTGSLGIVNYLLIFILWPC